MLYFRCPTCKTELANKQIPYEEEMKKIENNDKLSENEKDQLKMGLLSKLEVNNICCRMRVLTYLKQIELLKYTK